MTKLMTDKKIKTESESVLLDRIRDGDYLAFCELYNRHFDSLYGAAYNILRDHNDAKDIIQDIFVWFWEHRKHWNLTSCKGYLLTAVKFRTASYFREHKSRLDFYRRMATRPVEEIDESIELEVRQLQALIEQVTMELPDRAREVFALSRFEHLSNKEIAGKLSISEKTVEAHITTALKILREKLGKLSFLIYFFI